MTRSGCARSRMRSGGGGGSRGGWMPRGPGVRGSGRGGCPGGRRILFGARGGGWGGRGGRDGSRGGGARGRFFLDITGLARERDGRGPGVVAWSLSHGETNCPGRQPKERTGP